jgi:DNA polymerase/3'-5' exonuclease PolX
LERLIAGGRLTEIPGAGGAIADIITKLHRTGTQLSLEKLRKEIPGLRKGHSLVAAKEEDIYRALGLPFMEPELREVRGEIERALKASCRSRPPT